MLKWINRILLVGIITSACCFGSGCIDRKAYHDGNGKEWIMEQVQQGKLTQEQADELLKQEQEQEAVDE